METEQRIRVAVRIRPPLERERYDSTCARKGDDGSSLTILNEDQQSTGFSFDYTFDESDDQRTVYEEAAQELMDAALSGNNTTIFTYGQTGSGKTYTILGKVSESQSLCSESGLFLRVFGDLFEYKQRVAQRKQLCITLSAVELYVEDVMDLLNTKSKIRLRELGDDVVMTGLKMVEVQDMLDVLRQFQIANSFRSVTATKMNDSSSRSHALFLIDVFQFELSDESKIRSALGGPWQSTPGVPLTANAFVDDNSLPKTISGVRRSRIALVDLAGSERVKRSGVEGQGMVEAQAINKSLSTLGTVINAMYLQSAHVPFRESKLTKMLKSSFVDQASRLLLIGQIAPALESVQESMGTLRFCDRVKNLKVATATSFSNAEEELAYLAAMKHNEALCADIRIAKALHYYEVQRPRFFATVQKKATESVIKELLPSLQASAVDREKSVEEAVLTSTQRQAQQDRDASVSAFKERLQSRLADMKRQLEDAEVLIRKEKLEAKSHQKMVESGTDEKMTEAKKLKKLRLNSEEKVAKLKSALLDAEKNLGSLRKSLTAFIGSSPGKESPPKLKGTDASPPSSKRAPATGSSSTVNAGGHGFDDDDEVPTSTNATERQVKPLKKPTNNFDDDEDENASSAPNLQQTPARAVSPAAATITSPTTLLVPDLVTGDDDEQWRQFEQDWMQCEANHEVVSDFYFHVKPLHQLHMEYVQLLQTNWVTWGAANKARFRCSDVLQSSTLVPDILAFIVERATLIAENVIQASDSYAWIDIDGMSTRLKGPYELTPPLIGDSGLPRDPLPPGGCDHHVETYLAETEDEEDIDPATAGYRVAVNRQQLLGQESAEAATTREARDRRRKMKTTATGVTKKYDAEEADRQYLMTVYDSSTLVHDVTKYLKAGTVMLKHGRSGKPHNRLFWVTTVSFRMELVWVDPENKNGDRSSINLNDVSYISLGCFGRVFKRHPYPNTDKDFYLCFSVGLKDGGRTLDMVASTLPDFEAWVLGLAHLVRVDPHWGKPLDVSGFPETRQLAPNERHLCETQYIMPGDYLKVKDTVMRIHEEVKTHLRLFGNDQEQAFTSLGGIHVPQVNDRGAILMTKGELRYHCSPFGIDIFRCCKIWLLFQEFGFIYDPSFTPPTNFAVTCR